MSAVMRKEVETKIATAVVAEALAAGYLLTIDNGGGGEEFPPTADGERVLREMQATDDEHLIVYKNGKRFGWVYFVYGNSGWDVVSDFSTNLRRVMTEADRISDHYAG